MAKMLCLNRAQILYPPLLTAEEGTERISEPGTVGVYTVSSGHSGTGSCTNELTAVLTNQIPV